jgi:citrate lyase subunit beta/citryl-CoA lyase
MLPKVDSSTDIALTGELLDELGSNAAIIPLIETALGLQLIADIAHVQTGRVDRLAFGLGDLSLDLGINWSPLGVFAIYARCKIVESSRAARLKPPLDSAHPVIGDDNALRLETELARDIGFGAKMCLHPSQLNVVHEVFMPTKAEVERAARIVAAFKDASADGRAALVVEGQFVDYPVALRAVDILTEAGIESDWVRDER